MPRKETDNLILRLPPALAEIIRRRAQRLGRSLNAELIMLLRRGLVSPHSDDEATQVYDQKFPEESQSNLKDKS